MNGNWYPWSVTAANAADYAAAFAHIATLAHNFTGAKITVVWNPNVEVSPGGWSGVTPDKYYPGDAYVDVIGLDTYGNPLSGSDATPLDTSTNYLTLTAAIDFAKAHNKPFALPEAGGLDAAFANNLSSVVAASGVVVDYVGWWDYDDPDPNNGGNCSGSTIPPPQRHGRLLTRR